MKGWGQLSILRLTVMIVYLGVYLAAWRVDLTVFFFSTLIGSLSYTRAARYLDRMKDLGEPVTESEEIGSFLISTVVALGIVAVCVVTFFLPSLILYGIWRGVRLSKPFLQFANVAGIARFRQWMDLAEIVIEAAYLVAIGLGIAWTIRVVQRFQKTLWVINSSPSRRPETGEPSCASDPHAGSRSPIS